jgi:hypothetical protein
MQTKKVIFSEIDFLRIDKKYDMPNSFLHKKINELPNMNLPASIFWKLIIFPCYLIHSWSAPKITLNAISKDIRTLRIRKNFRPLPLRVRFSLVFYSLARVIVLDERRVNKVGNGYQILRNEINKSIKLGYTTEIYQGEIALEMLDRYCTTVSTRNWRDESKFRIRQYNCDVFVCVGFNSNKEIIAINATLVSNSYANTFFYSAIVKKNIRWLVTERLIEYAYSKGILLLHTDNLLDVSTGSYTFQKAMGYETVRLRFK